MYGHWLIAFDATYIGVRLLVAIVRGILMAGPTAFASAV